MPPESPLDDPDQEFRASARDHHEEAARAWREACACRAREVGRQGHDPEEAGYAVAAGLDDLHRTLRADLCDLLLSDEWESRRKV